jgi:hypothetical protein
MTTSGDWRDKMVSRIRTVIKQADPKAVEEVKWRGTPAWSHDGMICTCETYKNHVIGCLAGDPSGLFNADLKGNAWRAIDFHEGDKIDAQALKALIRSAVAMNAWKKTHRS